MCNHPMIIKLIDMFEDSKSIFIILEYLEGKHLFDYINKHKPSETRIKTIMKQILLGLKYLHYHGIAHRDIKLENIMMTSMEVDALPKYIDFGLSKVFTPNEKSQDPYGTLAYCSPEIILNKPHRLSTDIWSTGVMLHICLTNRIPFITNDKKVTFRNIV